VPRWLADSNRYRAELPAEVQAVLDREEAAGRVYSKEYEEATNAFYKRHLCRMDPLPNELEESLAKAGLPVYNTMWGPNEFYMSGTVLEDYDRSADLSKLGRWPVLFTCGRYDEAAPETVAWYQSLVPGSEMVVFERSSHTAHLEERDAYIAVARDFLRRAEA
jgi:proline iminopeptidase